MYNVTSTTTTSEPPEGRIFAAGSNRFAVAPPYSSTDFIGFVIFGGTTDVSYSNVLNDAWVFNFEDVYGDGKQLIKLEFGANALLPEARCLTSLVTIGDEGSDSALLFGGFNGSTWFNDVWKLEAPQLRDSQQHCSWTQVAVNNNEADGPPITCGHTALWWTGHNAMLVYGGGNDYENLLGHLWLFSLDTLSWTLLNNNSASLQPPPREFHVAALTKDATRMIVFGGYNYGYQYFNDLWSLDLDSLEWTKLCANCNTAPPARCHAAGTLTNDDSLFVVYGGQDKENVFNDAWAYSFQNDVWAPVGSTPYNG